MNIKKMEELKSLKSCHFDKNLLDFLIVNRPVIVYKNIKKNHIIIYIVH